MIRQCSWPIFSFYDQCEVHGTTQKTFINACLVMVHTKAAGRLNKPQKESVVDCLHLLQPFTSTVSERGFA